MRIEAVSKLRARPVFDADRLICRDRFGNPVAVVVEFAEDQFITSSLGDPNFETILENLGLRQSCVVDRMSEREMPRISI